MKVFVTGATGYIGHAVACAFSQRGHKVKGLVRSEEKKELLYRHEIEPVVGDLVNPDSYKKAVSNSDVLVHCASSQNDSAAELFLESKKFFIYTSGVWVIGHTNGVKIDESTPANPSNFISWREKQEQKILQSEHASIIRPGCVYGGSGSLTALFFESAAKGAMELLGDGNNHWAMIHQVDLAECYVKLAEKGLKKELFNVCDDTHYSLKNIAEHLAKYLNVPIHTLSKDEVAKRYPKSEGLLIDQWISNEKAKRILDWSPKHDFLNTIGIYYQAWKNRHQ